MDGIEKKKAKKQQSRVPFDTRLGMSPYNVITKLGLGVTIVLSESFIHSSSTFRLRIFDVLKVIPTNNRGKKISVLMTLDFTNE